MARDALLYALLIRLVQDTGSVRYTALFLLAYALPSVLFGLAAGVLADATVARPLLLVSHLGRAVVVGGMLAIGTSVWWLYVLLIGFSTIGQFVGPAEAAVLPRLVQPEKRSTAHSLVALGGMVGSVLGAAIFAPILLKAVGWRAPLAMAVMLYVLAALIVLLIRAPRVTHAVRTQPVNAMDILLHGWRALQTHPNALLIFGYLTIATALGKTIVALAPFYTDTVLGIAPENAVYIAAPAAIGSLVALAATPVLGKSLGLPRTATIGFFVLVLGLLSVGALVYVSDLLLTHVELHVGYIEDRLGPSPIIVITLILAILVGFGTMMLGIAGDTTVNHEIPPDSQARVHSTITTACDALALVPLFAAAAVADVVGVRAAMVSVALLALGTALFLRASRRQRAGATAASELEA